jgi:hypothetical protein
MWRVSTRAARKRYLAIIDEAGVEDIAPAARTRGTALSRPVRWLEYHSQACLDGEVTHALGAVRRGRCRHKSPNLL